MNLSVVHLWNEVDSFIMLTNVDLGRLIDCISGFDHGGVIGRCWFEAKQVGYLL